jgi:hypothetical protein
MRTGDLKPGASWSCPLRRQHTRVDSAFDFRTQVLHGLGAVRVLMYRLCDSRERVQSTVAIHLNGGLPPPSSWKICDLPCDTATAREPSDALILSSKNGRGPGI